MTSIRKFAYAALLAFSSLNFTPSLASAEELARGRFTLTHDVHWQTALVPAGEYRFSVDSERVGRVLTLSKLSGTTCFLFMVRDTEEVKPSDLNQLVLQTTPEGSYVSAMQLPEFGMTLRFIVPWKTTRKQVTQ